MPTSTSEPTSRETPDATLGGSQVSAPSNTGHGSTTVSPGVKTCRWFAFQGANGVVTAITLKITHSSNGTLSGATAENSFTVSYSLNGGSSWTDAVARTNFTASQSGTFSVALSASQNISQVQVRDNIVASELDVGDTATVSATVSAIRLEITTALAAPPPVVII